MRYLSTIHSISRKTKLQIIGTNLLLFLLLFGIVTLNKSILRPNISSSALAYILTGSLPNFAAAYFVSLCVVNPVIAVKPRFDRILVYLSSLIVFILLTIEELTGVAGASKQIDIFDILASALGAIFACITFELLVNRAKDRVTGLKET